MLSEGCKLELVSPAKVNLSLAVLGRRPDGFHALHSVVAQTVFGDTIGLQWDPGASGGDRLVVDGATLPERDNTLWQALRLFRDNTGCHHGRFSLRLQKRIPVGSGLGGGSSNGVAVLRGLRSLAGDSLPDMEWQSMAGQIGSDCPLFLEDEPVIMEGRGECIQTLEKDLADRINGRPLVLFKPYFPINTAEAYARLAAAGYYQSSGFPAELMSDWKDSTSVLPQRCNDFERLLPDWIPSLAIVLERLRNDHHLDARLSGSGSACFIFPNNPESAIRILNEVLEDAWGRAFWIQQTFVK